ncbi:hypothetical protein CHELA1G2_14506 [Hyphomicrobiales bacterium]|nr:hypothetical protein CHELA1G2_14506 [Hyphomicrobiales bacterium]
MAGAAYHDTGIIGSDFFPVHVTVQGARSSTHRDVPKVGNGVRHEAEIEPLYSRSRYHERHV